MATSNLFPRAHHLHAHTQACHLTTQHPDSCERSRGVSQVNEHAAAAAAATEAAEAAEQDDESQFEGEWECLECYYPANHRDLTECHHCGAPRPEDPGEHTFHPNPDHLTLLYLRYHKNAFEVPSIEVEGDREAC